eukprot:m.214681 g.214681  ORF g.214681 m.214681 type:complete len:320 (+) comp15532_c0_seq1:37-996(+)
MSRWVSKGPRQWISRPSRVVIGAQTLVRSNHSFACMASRFACAAHTSLRVDSRVCFGTNPRSRCAAAPSSESGHARASSAAAPVTPPAGGGATESEGQCWVRSDATSSLAVNENPAIAYPEVGSLRRCRGVSIRRTSARTRSSRWIIGSGTSGGTLSVTGLPSTADSITSSAYSVVPAPHVGSGCNTPGITAQRVSPPSTRAANSASNARHRIFCRPYSEPGSCSGCSTNHRAVAPSLGDPCPNEPIESEKHTFLTPWAAQASSSTRIPPTVTASATSGLAAVSTDRGAARFQTHSIVPACLANTALTESASRTSTPNS